MRESNRISAGHLAALHTLFGIFAARSLDITPQDARCQRLSWAGQIIGREIASFRDLTDAEAGRLMDVLKQAVGQEVSPPIRQGSRRPRSRQGAEAAGLEGRRGYRAPDSLALPEDLAPIEEMRQRLGWTREAFEAWLRSPSSPLNNSTPILRTLADCNRVRWALKALLKRAGLWSPRRFPKRVRDHSSSCAPSPMSVVSL